MHVWEQREWPKGESLQTFFFSPLSVLCLVFSSLFSELFYISLDDDNPCSINVCCLVSMQLLHSVWWTDAKLFLQAKALLLWGRRHAGYVNVSQNQPQTSSSIAPTTQSKFVFEFLGVVGIHTMYSLLPLITSGSCLMNSNLNLTYKYNDKKSFFSYKNGKWQIVTKV